MINRKKPLCNYVFLKYMGAVKKEKGGVLSSLLILKFFFLSDDFVKEKKNAKSILYLI